MESVSPKPEKYAIPMPKLVPVSFPERPKRKRDRAGKQQALMMAAARLFAERGFEATTTREIAAAASCAEGLIHRYFGGKDGLFRALIEKRNSRNSSNGAPRAATFEADFLKLVENEVELRWEERDFLRMTIPRALLDPNLGALRDGQRKAHHEPAIVARLKQFPECQNMYDQDIEMLARLIPVLGFSFGFLQPVIFGQDRLEARSMATAVAKLLIRNLQR